jgi:predicted DNA-binding transcriptional regulator AlpA
MTQRRWARTEAAAAHAGLAKSTFERYRITGEGPPFSKTGKVVLYDLADVDAWLDARRRSSTSDAENHAA